MTSKKIRKIDDAMSLAEYVLDSIAYVQQLNEDIEWAKKYDGQWFIEHIDFCETNKKQIIKDTSDWFFEQLDKHVDEFYGTLVTRILDDLGFQSRTTFDGGACVEVTFEGYFTLKR